MNNRIEKKVEVYHAINEGFINKREITKITKIIFRLINLPILSFGCETSVLTLRQISKMILATEKESEAKITCQETRRNGQNMFINKIDIIL